MEMNEYYYRFSSMELLQFAATEEHINWKGLNANNQIRFQFVPDSNGLLCDFSFSLKEDADQKLVLKVEVQSRFEIREDSLLQITSNNEMIFPIEMLVHFASLTYSSMRGMVLAKAENTNLRGFILPIQNFQVQITKPYVYKQLMRKTTSGKN